MTDPSPFSALAWSPDPGPAPAARRAADLSASPLFAQSIGWTDQDEVPSESSRVPADIDWGVVAELVSTISERVGDLSQHYAEDHGADPGPDERRAMTIPVIAQVVGDHARRRELEGQLWRESDEARYRKAAADQMFGMGRLQSLFEIPGAENVIIVGTQPVIVDYNDGRQETRPPVADTDAELMAQLQRMAGNATPRRAFDADHTDVTIMYGEQFRIHAVSNEVALHPSVVIRQHLMTRVTLGDLSARAMMPLEVAQFLDAAVQDGASIVVAGEQGAGKTTFLRALIGAIPPRERFATLETDEELFAHRLPGRQDTLTMFARDGMGETDPRTGQQTGAIEIGALIPPALRQSLTRIIVGEVRGSEASAMFQAMQSGAGTMSSIHARQPDEVASRLAMMIAQGPVYSLAEAMLQIGQSLDYVVFLRKRDLADGTRIRFVERITSVELGDSTRPVLGEIYTADEWTGQMIAFTPGTRADRYARYIRDLDHGEGDRR